MVVETSVVALAALLSAVTAAWLHPCDAHEQPPSDSDEDATSESIELLIQPVASPARLEAAEEELAEAPPEPMAESSPTFADNLQSELSDIRSSASDIHTPDTPFQTYRFPSTESLPSDETPQTELLLQPPTPPKSPREADRTPEVASPAPRSAPEERYVRRMDSFIRQRHDFYSPGYMYNIDRLKQEVPPPKDLKICDRAAFVRFLRSHPKFHIVNGKSVELTDLTPLRTKGLRAQGFFHCVVQYCDHHWKSDESYSDCFQCCPRCNAVVYPYKQLPLAEDMRMLVPIDEDTTFAKTALEGSPSGRTTPPRKPSPSKPAATAPTSANRRSSRADATQSTSDSRAQAPRAELKKQRKPVQAKR